MFVAFQDFDSSIDFVRYFEHFRKETFSYFVELEIFYIVKRRYRLFEGMARWNIWLQRRYKYIVFIRSYSTSSKHF